MSRMFQTMQACLLSGFSAVLSRTCDCRDNVDEYTADFFSDHLSQDTLEAIRYQRKLDEAEEQLQENSVAYLVHAAFGIALGVDQPRNNIQPFHNDVAGLQSIFNHLNQGKRNFKLAPQCLHDGIQYPSEEIMCSGEAYSRILAHWKSRAGNDIFMPDHTDALLELLHDCCSYIPPVDGADDRGDVSAYHLSKAAAAIGCCLERWMDSTGITDYRQYLYRQTSAMMNEKAFVLLSMDLSGIQSFIYTISSKGALKGLRARSFYLSMLMEHIADMVLEDCGLYRVNLIYSGGGRAHLLLPNDGECLKKAEAILSQVNAFLKEKYGTSLFLAWGHVMASANEISSSTASDRCFSDLFHAVSAEISRLKLQRYTPDELLEFNRRERHPASDRECVICGQSGHLVPHGNDEMICETCSALESFSNTLTENNLLLAVYKERKENSIPLPGGMWLARYPDADANSFQGELPDSVVRMYAINSTSATFPHTVSLRIGNYRACNDDGTGMTFDELADKSEGITRLGVLRADVDNLGALFASGFRSSEDANPHRYETLTRYMALSAAMNDFFQRDINRIIATGTESWIPNAQAPALRRVTIVYSGGDDVFLVGAWNEVLDAGLALQKAFSVYTGGAVTLSAGFGLFTPHEPVGIMADVTADLEESAKLMADGTKNAIALFASDGEFTGGITFDFHWDTMRENVLREKMLTLYSMFSENFSMDHAAGNAFLYQVLALLRDIKRNPISIARLVYLLARHAPEKSEASKERQKDYDAFSRSIYTWAMEPEDNRALQAAILLHVYANRKEQTEYE